MKGFWRDKIYFVRKRFQPKKKTHSRWSGKNCYEKESDDIHHHYKNNLLFE